ncbi:MAG TPA: hypothetical protein VEU96_19715 [Bryobacteraceae bacterium]|nr:hypothetical protein [Bryobacteraceae bacterium]
MDKTAGRPSVAEISADFRAAIIAGDHSRAQEIASFYVSALGTLWESLPAEQRISSDLPEQAGKLMRWGQQATMIQRNLASDQLASLHRAIRYRQSAASPSLQVKA